MYVAEEDEQSPFFGNEYSEFEFTHTVYNYYIHPQWDDFGSRTLFMKILYADYEAGFAIFELIGEWNDAIENDIMTLRREIMDDLQDKGIKKFVLIAENVLNFHSSDDSYYEDWREELAEVGGWAVIMNLPEQSQYDYNKARLYNFVPLIDIDNWRTMQPEHLVLVIEDRLARMLA